MHAPCQHLMPEMRLMDDSIPFTEGGELIMDILVDARGTGDVYIDDLIQHGGQDDSILSVIQAKIALKIRPSEKFLPNITELRHRIAPSLRRACSKAIIRIPLYVDFSILIPFCCMSMSIIASLAYLLGP